MSAELIIYKSRMKYGLTLLILFILIGIVFLAPSDVPNSWIEREFILTLFCVFLVPTAYNFLDRRPMYILDDKGLFIRKNNQNLLWDQLSAFKVVKRKFKGAEYIQIEIFDRSEQVVALLDLAYADLELLEVECFLRKKINKKRGTRQ
ncbi:hypothetical protein [Desertivirga arenae]|uniref:hypothetical protein n=1 Tax=Desertivirga arenae TaxID=2810309 RepID=UPI001A95E614|nr:hypothetical protein [Pedobacter sp. SYSU D00823]